MRCCKSRTGWELRRQRGGPGQQVVGTCTNQQLVQVLTSLDRRFQDVETWAKELQVVQDLLGLDRDLYYVKKLKGKGNIS